MKVYTYNSKVLTNSATDKWLTKKEAPAGFVMDASNITSSTSTHASWESPGYPDGWNGGGKTLELTVTQDITVSQGMALMYSDAENTNGPVAIDFVWPGGGTLSAGKYTFTMSSNVAPTSQGYGKYMIVNAMDDSTSIWLPYISMKILD